MAPLRRYSADIVQPFLDSSVELVDNAFVTWYRAASARVRPMRWVLEDTATIHARLRALQMLALREGRRSTGQGPVAPPR